MTTTPPDARNALAEIVAGVTRDEAINFLENACRNWSHVPRLSEDDIGDVATALLWFVNKRTTTNKARIAALEAQVEGMRELETRMRDAGLPGFADHIRRIIGDRAALQSSETTGEK